MLCLILVRGKTSLEYGNQYLAAAANRHTDPVKNEAIEGQTYGSGKVLALTLARRFLCGRRGSGLDTKHILTR